MKIVSATTSLFRSGDGTGEPRCSLELHTDEGLVGVAIGDLPVHQNARALSEALLLGADPRAVVALWQTLTAANARHDGSLSTTIAALDLALWDLKAKHNEEPLWRTLGGSRPKINSHVRVPQHLSDDASFELWCKSTLIPSSSRGATLTSSGQPYLDSRRLEYLRDSFRAASIEPALMLDARERWSPKDAIRAIRAMEREVDLTWIESPTTRTDFLGHKRIGDSIRGAVCAGGRLTSAAEFLPHLHHRSINVVQLDCARVGITGALQIADAAYGFELPIALAASPGNLHAHLGAVLPYCASLELNDSREIQSDVRVEGGWAIAGDRHGHGLKIDSLHSSNTVFA